MNLDATNNDVGPGRAGQSLWWRCGEVLFEQVQQDANCETHTPSSHTLVALQGSYFAWKASAIGKNMVNAKTFLEKRFSEELELEDAIHTAILTLKVLIFPFDHDPR